MPGNEKTKSGILQGLFFCRTSELNPRRMMNMKIKKIHHVAYRCINAKQTVEWYRKYLNMDFVLAIAENQVPSTKAPDPYMHVFLDAGGGNILAFFEIPTYPSMGKDPNTPDWVQHLAFEIESLEEQNEVKTKLELSLIHI